MVRFLNLLLVLLGRAEYYSYNQTKIIPAERVITNLFSTLQEKAYASTDLSQINILIISIYILNNQNYSKITEFK